MNKNEKGIFNRDRFLYNVWSPQKMTNNLNSISNKFVIILWICMKRTWSEVYSPSPKQDTLSPLFPRFLSKETHWINHFYNNKHFKLVWDLKEPKSKAKTNSKICDINHFYIDLKHIYRQWKKHYYFSRDMRVFSVHAFMRDKSCP